MHDRHKSCQGFRGAGTDGGATINPHVRLLQVSDLLDLSMSLGMFKGIGVVGELRVTKLPWS